MNKFLPKTVPLLAAAVLMATGLVCHAAPIELLDVNFGSDPGRDGLGGFSGTGFGTWTESSTFVNYARPSGGNESAYLQTDALTGANALSTAAGNTYHFSSVIQYNSIVSSRISNARIGMSLFTVGGENGIQLRLIPTDTFAISTGIDGPNPTAKAWGGRPFSVATNGFVYTLESTLTFTTDEVEVSFTLTDDQSTPFSDTISVTIAKADLTLGDNFRLPDLGRVLGRKTGK